MITPRKLKSLYEQGNNISALLREEQGLHYNTNEVIELSYDLQAGSYIKGMMNEKMALHKTEYASEIAKIILSLCEPASILEAGVGEATTLSGVLKHLNLDIKSYGFDLSWSRVAYARSWLLSQDLRDTTMCTGDLYNIPFSDNSIDVVYTSHSIEPNGGNEEPILKELYRITKKYLILLEPGYELASNEAKRRMDSHGYCKNIQIISKQLGYNVISHELFPFSANPLNPTAITIIKKDDIYEPPSQILVCPKFKTPLEKIDNMLFSPEGLVVYPILRDIPCLRIENAIVASKFKELMSEE